MAVSRKTIDEILQTIAKKGSQELPSIASNASSNAETLANLAGQVGNTAYRLQQSGVDTSSVTDTRNPFEKMLNLTPDQNLVFDLFELIQRPQQAVFGAVNEIIDVAQGDGSTWEDVAKGFGKGIMGEKTTYGGEVIRNALNIEEEKGLSTLERMADPINWVGLAMDVVLDPADLGLALVTGGASVVASTTADVAKVADTALDVAKVADTASDAAKTFKIGDFAQDLLLGQGKRFYKPKDFSEYVQLLVDGKKRAEVAGGLTKESLSGLTFKTAFRGVKGVTTLGDTMLETAFGKMDADGAILKQYQEAKMQLGKKAKETGALAKRIIFEQDRKAYEAAIEFEKNSADFKGLMSKLAAEADMDEGEFAIQVLNLHEFTKLRRSISPEDFLDNIVNSDYKALPFFQDTYDDILEVFGNEPKIVNSIIKEVYNGKTYYVLDPKLWNSDNYSYLYGLIEEAQGTSLLSKADKSRMVEALSKKNPEAYAEYQKINKNYEEELLERAKKMYDDNYPADFKKMSAGHRESKIKDYVRKFKKEDIIAERGPEFLLKQNISKEELIDYVFTPEQRKYAIGQLSATDAEGYKALKADLDAEINKRMEEAYPGSAKPTDKAGKKAYRAQQNKFAGTLRKEDWYQGELDKFLREKTVSKIAEPVAPVADNLVKQKQIDEFKFTRKQIPTVIDENVEMRNFNVQFTDNLNGGPSTVIMSDGKMLQSKTHEQIARAINGDYAQDDILQLAKDKGVIYYSRAENASLADGITIIGEPTQIQANVIKNYAGFASNRSKNGLKVYIQGLDDEVTTILEIPYMDDNVEFGKAVVNKIKEHFVDKLPKQVDEVVDVAEEVIKPTKAMQKTAKEALKNTIESDNYIMNKKVVLGNSKLYDVATVKADYVKLLSSWSNKTAQEADETITNILNKTTDGEKVIKAIEKEIYQSELNKLVSKAQVPAKPLDLFETKAGMEITEMPVEEVQKGITVEQPQLYGKRKDIRLGTFYTDEQVAELRKLTGNEKLMEGVQAFEDHIKEAQKIIGRVEFADEAALVDKSMPGYATHTPTEDAKEIFARLKAENKYARLDTAIFAPGRTKVVGQRSLFGSALEQNSFRKDFYMEMLQKDSWVKANLSEISEEAIEEMEEYFSQDLFSLDARASLDALMTDTYKAINSNNRNVGMMIALSFGNPGSDNSAFRLAAEGTVEPAGFKTLVGKDINKLRATINSTTKYGGTNYFTDELLKVLDKASEKGNAAYMEKHLYNMMLVFADKKPEDAWKLVDMFNNMFKTGKTLSPAFNIKNIFGNATNQWLSGVPMLDIMKYANKSADVQRKIPKILEKVADETAELSSEEKKIFEYYKEFLDYGFLSKDDRFIYRLNDLSGAWESKAFNEKETWDMLNNPLTKANMKANKWVDDTSRLSLYLYAKEHPEYLQKLGFDPADTKSAMNAVRMVHFDPNDLSFFEDDFMKRLVPFYTFTRQNLAFQMKNIMINSERYNKLYKAMNGWSREIVGVDPKELSKFEREQFYLPIYSKNGDNYTALKTSLPVNVLAEFTLDPTEMAQNIVSKLTPAVKAPFELASGKNMFSGQEISSYEGEMSKNITLPFNISKKTEWLIGQVGLDTPLRGVSGLLETIKYGAKAEPSEAVKQLFETTVNISSSGSTTQNALYREYDKLDLLNDKIKAVKASGGTVLTLDEIAKNISNKNADSKLAKMKEIQDIINNVKR